MAAHIGSRRVKTPSGIEWRVGRRWAARGFPRWNSRAGRDAGQSLDGLSIIDVGSFDSLAVLAASVVVGVVLLFIVIPLLLFGIELIAAGLVVAAGIGARSALGRPWIVQATPSGEPSGTLSWEINGWRRSAQLIEDITAEISAGLTPSPTKLVSR